jgi:hypothetical protein
MRNAARWLAALVAVGTLACGGGSPCSDACNKIAGCQLCVTDANTGACLTSAQCTSQCQAQSNNTSAACVNAVSGCNQTAIQACLAR